MNAADLCNAMEKHDITSADLARWTGCSGVAVWKWRNGFSAVPKYVETIIRFRTAAIKHTENAEKY